MADLTGQLRLEEIKALFFLLSKSATLLLSGGRQDQTNNQ